MIGVELLEHVMCFMQNIEIVWYVFWAVFVHIILKLNQDKASKINGSEHYQKMQAVEHQAKNQGVTLNLCDFPPEVIENILSYLPPIEIYANIRKVCHRLRKIAGGYVHIGK